MSTMITELDYALNCAAIEIDTTNARAELASLRAAVAERDAVIERMHKALIDVIEHQSELNNSYGRPISHSKTIALSLSGLNEDEAAAIRARGEKVTK